MSRTYRRLKQSFWEHNTPQFITEFPYTERELRKLYTDAHRTFCRDRGPRWFKRMTHTIPDRRFSKRDLFMYMRNPDNHEEMCNISYQNKEYWS